MVPETRLRGTFSEVVPDFRLALTAIPLLAMARTEPPLAPLTLSFSVVVEAASAGEAPRPQPMAAMAVMTSRRGEIRMTEI